MGVELVFNKVPSNNLLLISKKGTLTGFSSICVWLPPGFPREKRIAGVRPSSLMELAKSRHPRILVLNIPGSSLSLKRKSREETSLESQSEMCQSSTLVVRRLF